VFGGCPAPVAGGLSAGTWSVAVRGRRSGSPCRWLGRSTWGRVHDRLAIELHDDGTCVDWAGYRGRHSSRVPIAGHRRDRATSRRRCRAFRCA